MNDKEFEAFRDSLCDAAIKIVAEEGIGSLTLRRLASFVGCSRQTPYRYFRSKNELLEEVYVRCHEVFIRYCEEAAEGVADPRDKLRNIHDACLRFFRDEHDIYQVLSGTRPPIPMPRVTERQLYEFRCLRSIFDEAIAAGFVAGDGASLAFLFSNALQGLAKLESEGQDVFDTNRISEHIERAYYPPDEIVQAKRHEA